MATLDRVIQMQNQGIQDQEIIQQLKNEKINPTEIEDALNQAKIKSAVSPQEAQQPAQVQAAQPEPSQIPADMQQSIMQEPIPPSGQMPQEQIQQQVPTEAYYPQTPQAYSEQAYYQQQAPIDTETITEIAEQVILEKLNEFNQKVGDISSFKTQTQEKLKELDERLKRIEDSINNLQQAVIQKIGEFSETSEFIHKDLDNLHGTVSKLMNPLIDNYKELKKITKGK